MKRRWVDLERLHDLYEIEKGENAFYERVAERRYCRRCDGLVLRGHRCHSDADFDGLVEGREQLRRDLGWDAP